MASPYAIAQEATPIFTRLSRERDQARDLAARFGAETTVLSDALHDLIAVSRGQIQSPDAAEALIRNAERVLDELHAVKP